MGGRFSLKRVFLLAAAVSIGVGVGPAAAQEDAAFIPAGQDFAWFSAARFRLTDALAMPGRQVPQAGRALSVSSEPLRTPPASAIARLPFGGSLGLAVDGGLDSLIADLRDNARPSFLVAGDPLVDIGFQRRQQTALAFRGYLAGWGVTASAETGQVAGSGAELFGGRLDHRRRRPASAARYGLTFDRDLGPVVAVLGGSLLTENQTILGARIREGYNPAGADSLFLDVELSWWPRDGWRVGAAWRHGITQVAPIGGFANDLRLVTNAWAFDVTHSGVLGEYGALSLRVSQPLRVANDAARAVPVEYGYEVRGNMAVATGATLSPTGREIIAEFNWQGPALGGWATAGLYVRRDPGHFSSLPDDHGAAVNWSARF